MLAVSLCWTLVIVATVPRVGLAVLPAFGSHSISDWAAVTPGDSFEVLRSRFGEPQVDGNYAQWPQGAVLMESGHVWLITSAEPKLLPK